MEQATEIHLGAQGRMVIPAAFRRELNLNSGDRLIARTEEGRLVLEKQELVMRRLQQRFKVVPEGISLADELIAERRAESQREHGQ
ncbi:MAG: AbrB/MazE/SpoVT family DNA-binding domain-containing protein [SAR324 cluster bacterium]|nr:AbrB/MazE/SpoVT family DNA-binding domain-containing protein [SAR324 cluster bacterium]